MGTSSATPTQRDPDSRLRPFRIVAWAVYLVVASAFSLAVAVSVARSVARMTPSKPPRSAVVLPLNECAEQARRFFQELEDHRRRLALETGGASTADARWAEFRLEWLTRVRSAEANCGVDDAGREELNAAFDLLERVLDHYTTHTIQFSGAVGPTVDKLRGALERLP